MGENPTERPELVKLQLPRRGLDVLLRGWSSDGQLFDALSAVSDVEMDIKWSARDIERRAARVLLERMEADLGALPVNAATWREHLPVSTTSVREVTDRPLHPTNWSITARRYGWPPTSYVAHPRSRVRDETALTTLAWTGQKLARIGRDVQAVAPLLVRRTEVPILAMLDVIARDLAEIEAVRPDRLVLRSLAGSGRPWVSLATVAGTILRAETDLEFLAFELVEPDPELEWRLFHLSVLGEVLTTLRQLGGRVTWHAPLSAAEAVGPQFQVRIGADIWDLWFEAAGAASHYGYESPYQRATAGVRRNQRNIGADIMLSLPGIRSLAMECKWSANGSYVGRDGYHQATAYAVEIRSGLGHDAWSFVVGPDEVVPTRTEAALSWPGGTATIGACNITHIDSLVTAFVGITT